jgi:hypothetical protein
MHPAGHADTSNGTLQEFVKAHGGNEADRVSTPDEPPHSHSAWPEAYRDATLIRARHRVYERS